MNVDANCDRIPKVRWKFLVRVIVFLYDGRYFVMKPSGFDELQLRSGTPDFFSGIISFT